MIDDDEDDDYDNDNDDDNDCEEYIAVLMSSCVQKTTIFFEITPEHISRTLVFFEIQDIVEHVQNPSLVKSFPGH